MRKSKFYGFGILISLMSLGLLSTLYTQDYSAYEAADLSAFDDAVNEIKEEKEKNTKKTEGTKQEDYYASNSDSHTKREITITNDSILTEIENIQNKIDALNNYKDEYFLEMQELNSSDKKRYISFLLENHLKDTTDCINFCHRIHQILTFEYEKLYIMAQAQTGNTKSFLNQHMKSKYREMGMINNIILDLDKRE